jgi:hypothetical protein
MDNSTKNWKEIGNDSPFTTPEGYFDNLTGRIMDSLPEKTSQPTKVVTIWAQVKPWIYMAAMFAGIYLMINMFTTVFSPSNDSGITEMSASEVEDFYEHYADEMAGELYNDYYYLAWEE